MGDDKKKKAVDDPNIAGGDFERAAEARFQAQCFLLRNISSKMLRNPTKKYSQFTVVHGDPARVMNAMTSRAGAGILMNLKTEEMANLSPYIRLYKVYNTKHLHGAQYQFPFSMGSYVDTAQWGSGYTKRDIFKNRKNRGADAGIESVDFELLAQRPEEQTNHIRCTVNLFFRSLATLTEAIKVPAARGDTPGKKDHTMYYSELVTRPPMYKGTADDEAGGYDSSLYRIKLAIGWNKTDKLRSAEKAEDPRGSGNSITRDYAIKLALERTELVLNLTLKKHTFKFNPDGSVKVEIEYHAWSDGAMSAKESNLFYLGAYQQKQIAQLKAAKEFRQAQSDEIEAGEGARARGEDTGLLGMADSDLENIQEDIETIDEKMLEIRKEQMGASWQRFMDRLLPSQLSEVKIYHVQIPAYKIGAGIEGDISASGKGTGSNKKTAGFNINENDPDDHQLARRLSQQWNRRQCRQLKEDKGKNDKLSAVGLGASRFKTTSAKFADRDLHNWMSEIFEKQRSGEGEGFSMYDTAVEESEDLLKKLTPSWSRDSEGDFVDVHFFFLGDLINVALKILNGNKAWKDSPASALTILSGPISFPHPCAREDTVHLNIADIPISLSLFTGWFIKKVISKQRSTYLFRNFINDVVGDLLGPALGEQCTAGAGKTSARISSNTYTIRSNKYRKTTFGKPEFPLERGERYDENKIFRIINKHGVSKQRSEKVAEFPYVFLYSTTTAAANLKCNRKIDQQTNGIYHFDFGRETGPIYKMEFEKNDAPYLGEAKVTGKNNIGADLGGGSLYNVTIEMFGNSVFWPGQYIYVNPGSYGISSATGCPNPKAPPETQDIATRIRMGGYYVITKVEGTLTRGQYMTKITARWESDGGAKGRTAKSPGEKKTPFETYKNETTGKVDRKKRDDIIRGLELAEADEYDTNPSAY